MKSLRRKDGNDEPPSPRAQRRTQLHKEKRSNETHASTTDRDARLARKSNGEVAKLAFTGHLLMENRNGLVVDACLTHATGPLNRRRRWRCCRLCRTRATRRLVADKAYDTAAFVAEQPRRRCDPACGPEHQRASRIEHRRADDAPRWLPAQSGGSQADRGGERLAHAGRRDGANQAARG